MSAASAPNEVQDAHISRTQSAYGVTARYQNVDVLRGVAALCVVWLHASEVFIQLPGIQRSLTYELADYLQVGRAGVIAFFAISGFVVASTIKPPPRAGVINFAIKRFFRLYPAFWLALALSYLVIWLPQGRVPSFAGVLANATMLPTIFGIEGAMGHFWTLEIELVFYMLIVVLFLARKLRNEWFIFVLVCLLALNPAGLLLGKLTWTEGQGHWSQLPLCLAIMFWASLLRARYDPRTSAIEKLKAWKTIPIIVGGALIFSRAISVGAILKAPDLSAYLSGRGTLWGLVLFLIFVLLRNPWPRSIAWLGTVSYSIYLFHPVVLYPLMFLVSSQALFKGASVGAYTLVVILLTILLASVTYFSIEAPSNRFAARHARH